MDRRDGFFAGVDWGSESHHVRMVSADAAKKALRVFRHGGAGLAEMAEWIAAAGGGDATGIPVAIEVPPGPVVESLMDRGFRVHSLDPKQLDRFRDRFSPAGAKDDSRDARVLARTPFTRWSCSAIRSGGRNTPRSAGATATLEPCAPSPIVCSPSPAPCSIPGPATIRTTPQPAMQPDHPSRSRGSSPAVSSLDKWWGVLTPQTPPHGETRRRTASSTTLRSGTARPSRLRMSPRPTPPP